MKNRSINILIVSMLLLTLMGVMLAAFLGKAKEDYPNEITVKENGVTESILRSEI